MAGAKAPRWRLIFSTEFASCHSFNTHYFEVAPRFWGNSWTRGNAYNILVGKPEVKKVLGKSKY
jgi:hypothetical protein